MAKKILVGSYSVSELKEKKDKKELAQAQQKYGLTYTQTKIVSVKGQMVLKVWLIDNKTFYNQTLIP